MNPSLFHPAARLSLLGLAALLSACASLSPGGDEKALSELTQGRLAGQALQNPQEPSAQTKVADLLRQPLTQSSAVQLALLNSPSAHVALARLGLSDAERVLASNWPAPHLMIGRLTEGDTREIERSLSFNLLGLLTLPWQAQVQSQQHDMQRLQTAQELIRLAANARKAWVQAVAAEQTARYMTDALDAAQASAELARRMVKAGNWSEMQGLREQLQLSQVQAQLQAARHQAVVEREALNRLLGLSGEQIGYKLPERLPDLPRQLTTVDEAQTQALRERLDVRSARLRTQQLAKASGLESWQAWSAGMELTAVRSTTLDRSTGASNTQRGWELSLPLPVFDGGARSAKADAQVREAAAQLRQVSVLAASEARQAWSAAASAHANARQYRDQVLPLRKKLSEEVLLRYNGMLIGVFDVLADARNHIATVNAALLAERDFWLAQADLDTALTGTSPQGMATLQSGAANAAPTEQGH
jgi:multidrug efflux system outer membrane protein